MSLSTTDLTSGCTIIFALVGIGITALAFYWIFRSRNGDENDMNVLQRQLRGFALLIVANFITVIGLFSCSGKVDAAYLSKMLNFY